MLRTFKLISYWVKDTEHQMAKFNETERNIKFLKIWLTYIFLSEFLVPPEGNIKLTINKYRFICQPLYYERNGLKKVVNQTNKKFKI